MAGILRYARRPYLITLLAGAAVMAASGVFGKSHPGLSGHGTLQISDVGPCSSGPDTCYTVNCTFPTGGHDISATCTGQGMTDPNTCQTKGKMSCCQATMNLEFTVDEGGSVAGTFGAGFVGLQCDKPVKAPTVETLKGNLTATNGTGVFAGETGTGALSAKIDPNTGGGTVSASVHGK